MSKPRKSLKSHPLLHSLRSSLQASIPPGGLRSYLATRKNHQPRFQSRQLWCETLEHRHLLAADPILSEFMASNDSTALDEDGESSDWIEILNAGDSVANMDGWYLTDNAADLTKWRFPAVNIDPGDSLVVFASGKDRDNAPAELHTNFRISADGEYLALVATDGMTIATGFAPGFPQQVEDVSYGIPSVRTVTKLVDSHAQARVMIPTDDTLDPIGDEAIEGTWLDPSLDTSGPGWFSATTGIGFQADDSASSEQIADSSADWSHAGNQGEENWHYGYYNRDSDNNGSYDASDFVAFPNNYFVGVVYDWPGGNPPYTLIGQQNMNPNGVNSGDEHWAIRRYESEVSGTLEVTWTVAKSNLALGGNGVTGHVFHNGTEVDVATIAGDNNSGVSRTVIIPGVSVGDAIDFAVDPRGTDGQPNDSKDGSRLTAKIRTVTGIVTNIDPDGDIETRMHNVSSSAYVRIPFHLDDSAAIDVLSLSMKYDDGFVAYLNGLPVVSSNVTDTSSAGFSSTATVDRNDDSANLTETFDISSHASLLHNGENVLMIHAVNSDIMDDDFLIVPELTGTSLVVETKETRYFVDPTPGQVNGSGNREVGPLFLDHSFRPKSVDRTELIGEAASARVLIPVDDAVDRGWMATDFDDGGPGWFDATTGIGYEDESNIQAIQVADSIADWSRSGTQGENDWTYGYYNKTADGDRTFQVDDFVAFPIDYWAGAVWDWPNGNPPYTLVGQQVTQPNGTNSGQEHWPIRRYRSEAAGDLVVQWSLVKSGLARGGNGVTGRVFHNGVEVDSATIAGTNTTGIHRDLTVENVGIGDYIDFALDPSGSDGRADDTLDTSRMTATISGRPGLGSNIHPGGDIQQRMQGIASSAYVRIPFEVPESASYDTLSLELKYDDGVIVYLNGQRVVSSNVDDPSTAGFRSIAATARDRNDVLAFQQFNLNDRLPLLQTGTNVLAVHALNVSAQDADLLLIPRLLASGLSADQSEEITPRPDEAIVVTAHLTPTFAPIDSATLHYRVMYADESSIAMVDDGSGDDEVAGDRLFTATIPADIAQAGEMIRWYISANDTGIGASRLPSFPSPRDSEEYFGTVVHDPSTDASNLPLFHWFVEDPRLANSDRGARSSLFYDGEFYDNVRFDIHGQSTRSSLFPKKSYDVDFNRDHRFRWKDDIRRMKDINLLTNYADKSKVRNTLAYEIWREAGADYHLAEPIRLQQNGQFFGVYDFVEDGDDRFLQRLGLDPEGALYKGYNSLNTASGNQKITRRDEGFEDLQALIDGSRLRGQERKNFLFDNINIPKTINFLAAMIVNGNIDCCHKNYYVYRDTNGTELWHFLPWDVDLSFGRLWTRENNYFDEIIFFNSGVPYGSSSVTSALLSIREFRDMYLRRVRTLVDKYLQPPGTPIEDRYLESRLDDLVALIDPHDDTDPLLGNDDADLDYQKWGSWGNQFTMREDVDSIKTDYLPARRNFLYNTQTVGNGGEIPRRAASQDAAEIRFGTIEFNPSSGDQDQEFIQIVNDGRNSVDLSGWRLVGGVDHHFEPGTVLAASSSIYVTPDVVAFRARTSGPSGGQGLFVQGGFQGHLSNFGETIQLLDGNGAAVTEISYPGNPSDQQRWLRVSELMYNPADPTDDELAVDATLENDDFEFLEIVNISSADTVSLVGVKLTEGPSEPFRFGDSNVTSLEPHQRALVVSNLAAFEARYGPGHNVAGQYQGRLNNNGELIKLEDRTNSTILQFEYSDGPLWPKQADGVGGSLQVTDPAGTSVDRLSKYYAWKGSAQFNGSPGLDEQPSPGVIINEVLAHTESPVSDSDSIELFNTTGAPIDIGGWFLSDSSDDLLKFQIPAGTVIEPSGYVVFNESDFNPNPQRPGPKDFALSGSQGDDVWLVVPEGQGGILEFSDAVHFAASTNGEALGRLVRERADLVPLINLTLGSSNSEPRIGPVLISEVNYHPEAPSSEALAIDPSMDGGDLEFIEVYNSSGTNVSLDEWRIRGGVDFDFPSDAQLDPGETVVVVSWNPGRASNSDRLAAFRAHYGIGDQVPLIGPYSGQLNNQGERIQLQRPGNPPVDEPDLIPRLLEDELVYDNLPPWPPLADGGGESLARTSDDGWGSFWESWSAEEPTPGAIDRFIPQPGDSNLDRRFDQLDIVMALQGAKYRTGAPASFAEGDWNLDGVFDELDIVAALQTGNYRQGPYAVRLGASRAHSDNH